MDFKEFAVQTALGAGKILMRHYGRRQRMSWKTLTNYKTAVDDESDLYIRREIKRKYPSHQIISEEFKPKKTGSKYMWVEDPLDGTLPYSTQANDNFSVNIALCRGLTPIVGVTWMPKRNQLFVAELGRGATLNGVRIRVSKEKNPNHALLGGDLCRDIDPKYLVNYGRLLGKNGVVCQFAHGCASVPIALTAAGQIHGYWALKLLPWDMAPGVIINREAGARVTTIEGKEWQLGDPSILTANPALHAKLLARLNAPIGKKLYTELAAALRS